MSVVAVGPALDLDGPLPVAPPHSLLNTPGVIVNRDLTRVLNGVNLDAYPTGCASLWEPCSTGTFRLKEEESEIPQARFDSFVVYKPVMCSGIGLNPLAARKLSDKLEAVLDAVASAGVERALAEGVLESTNPFFGDSDVDVLAGGAAVSAGVALSYLENAIGRTCRQGMIHATPATISALQAIPDGSDALVTANGNTVVSGDGYIDVDTPDLAAQDPDGTTDWMFATGPVQVYLGPIEARDIEEALDRSDNTVVFRAERYVVAYWDTALQAAILVDWSL